MRTRLNEIDNFSQDWYMDLTFDKLGKSVVSATYQADDNQSKLPCPENRMIVQHYEEDKICAL